MGMQGSFRSLVVGEFRELGSLGLGKSGNSRKSWGLSKPPKSYISKPGKVATQRKR